MNKTLPSMQLDVYSIQEVIIKPTNMPGAELAK